MGILNYILLDRYTDERICKKIDRWINLFND